MNIDLVTGYGLSVIVDCEWRPDHNWMSFACWYSLSKNLPEARVILRCHRKTMRYSLFGWPHRVGVEIAKVSVPDATLTIPRPYVVMDCGFLALRPLNEEWKEFLSYSECGTERLRAFGDTQGPCIDRNLSASSHSDDSVTFVSYLEGAGKFVHSEWIDKVDSPFGHTEKLFSGSLSVNERKIGDLWRKLNPTYQALSRG